mmetsp:Transcript_84222/g.234948  ORF Transcript_84222/g.234948 Transcript_84222/m.234948 type:complete len:552 (+) Transcript_84222:41-1696(+)
MKALPHAEGASNGIGDAARGLHLVSWNVAGWKTTVQQIRRFGGGFPNFLQRHHVDILCLQEVKLTAKTVASEAAALCIEPPGYESFWACNEGLGAQRQGLNGVATFARCGEVLRADCAPLGDPDLDGEGRCLLTDHGKFVVFNAYVPNTAGGPRLPFKMRWLEALRAAMCRVRAAGKAVILAGDLNMKHRPVDSHWTFRPLSMPRLAELARSDSLEAELHAAAERVCAAWPAVREALRTKEHRAIETRNSRNGQTFQRWGTFVRTSSGDTLRLGQPVDQEEHARNSFLVDGIGVERDGSIVRGPASQYASYIIQAPDELCSEDLAECLKKLTGVELPAKELKQLANVGIRPTQASAVGAWFDAVLREDQMVDSFVEFYPHAEERFTCWDQYRNRRHANVGSRIDFVLVDRVFFERHAQQGSELEAHGHAPATSAAAALAAATLGGLSQPSPFAGGGMPTLEEDEYFAQFRTGPSTGIIYTPPQLSDHVAVSLLCGGLASAQGTVPAPTRDAATLRCQPHRSAKRITDFFSKKAAPIRASSPPAKRQALGAA